MYSSHAAKENLLVHSEKHTAYNLKKYTGNVQFARSEGKIYSHTAKSPQLTILKNIPACTVRTQRRKNLLVHNKKHTAYNLKKYTGIYSSHPAKEKFTRTQREAHSLQFEKIYRHVQFARSEGKIYSHTAKSTQLTILKNIPACTVRTQRRKNLLGHNKKHTAYNLKKYTGIYSSHPAKEKFTRTQREAHSLQLKISQQIPFKPWEDT